VATGAQTASGYVIGASDEAGVARLAAFAAVLRTHLG
jgi:hypothetical protein